MSGNAVEVDMVDLTCRSLPYDTHLVKGLRGIGMEVDLWTAGCLSEQQEAVERSAVLDFAGNTLALRGPFRKVAKGVEYLINGVELHWALRSEAPDIVHYQWLPFAEWISPLEVLNLTYAKKSGVGVVYTVHDVLPHDTGERYKDAFRQIYRIPDALICHTQSSKKQLVDDFGVPSDRIWAIPHGPSIERSYLHPPARGPEPLAIRLRDAIMPPLWVYTTLQGCGVFDQQLEARKRERPNSSTNSCGSAGRWI